MELDYARFFAELDRVGVKALIVGGLAVNLHGLPRMTYDLDLVVLLDPDNVKALADLLAGHGYVPRLPVSPADLGDPEKRRVLMEEKGLRAFTFVNHAQPLGEIDVILDLPASFEVLWDRAVFMSLGGVTVPVMGLEDLMTMKRRTGRRQDISDVEALSRLGRMS